MKSFKPLGLLLLALATGLAAALYAAGWLAQQGGGSRKIAVAAADIDSGSRLGPQSTRLVDWPSNSVPDGAFTDLAPLNDRVVKSNLIRGEPLVARKLSPAGSQGGLSAVISTGKRAMTVRVNDVVGVAGFALPGNHVDVMVNANQDHARGESPVPISMTVLEQVLVLAVAQEAGRDDTKPRVVNAVTLEVSPIDAEKLDLARSIGTLSLVLRNQQDRQFAATRGITKAELFGGARTQPQQVAARTVPQAPPARVVPAALTRSSAPSSSIARIEAQRPAHCVEVIHGVQRGNECF